MKETYNCEIASSSGTKEVIECTLNGAVHIGHIINTNHEGFKRTLEVKQIIHTNTSGMHQYDDIRKYYTKLICSEAAD